MIDTSHVIEQLSAGRGSAIDLEPEPNTGEIRDIETRFNAVGLCGRRVGEGHLVPYFLANDGFG